MLDSVDTLIAFVLIMLVVSLLITIAVQMVSALLNLRGRNLLNGLASTFTVIDPTIEKDRKELARFVLKGGLLSDSFLPNSFLQNRKNWPRLLWFLDKLNWWRHASAARPDEVFDAIHRIAIGKEPVGGDPKNPTLRENALRENAKNLLIGLGVDKQTLDDAAKGISEAGKTAKTLADSAGEALKLVPDEEVRNKIQDAVNAAVNAGTNQLQAAETAAATQIVRAAKAFDKGREDFKYWADICQERAQQRFTMHARIWTVLFAFVFALWLQLDAVEIFNLVSSNKAVRDKLVAQAGMVEAQAAKVLGDSSTVLKDALKAWSAKQTDPAIANRIDGIEVKDNDTRGSVSEKVATALDDKKRIDNFDAMINVTVNKRIKEQAGEFNTVKADFEKSGFDLFAKDNRFRWGKHWQDGWNDHIWGVLFCVGLLSLGAPFWYNTLKNIASLRSVVAQNISNEQKQDQKQANESKHKPPPLI